ncbi:hypothetical protein ACH4Y0_03010 [Streptomyces sp. NPDC020707]|uniref:hypothetical protein n=1 Tax=Streptomyces sp. NPDC020707 TaxID=3365084 RepID=UPI0037B32FF2
MQVRAEQCFTGDQAPTAPAARPGWHRVRQQIRFWYADGVMVVTASIISRRVDEYRQKIDWFGHYSGFIAVVIPEIQRGLT